VAWDVVEVTALVRVVLLLAGRLMK
jgi:hypothetical protein